MYGNHASVEGEALRQHDGRTLDLDSVLDIAGDLRASYRPDGSILLYDERMTTKEILEDPAGRLAIGIIEVVD